jgi:pilus assembly protein CpaE
MLDLSASADELPREAVGQILGATPQVLFIDLGESSTTGLRVLKVLSHDAPDLTMVVAGPALGAEALLEVMRTGAAEYLPRPFNPGDVTAAFERVRRRLGPTKSEGPAPRGRVISVFSAKGGTGVTTVAANLAVFLRQRTEKPTLLLDLNPSLGTAALILGLRPRYSYLDVIQNFHRIDDELLESFLEEDPHGVSVLSSPTLVTDGTSPTTEQILGLVRLCQRHFANVVIDAGASVTGPIAEVLRESDERLVVSTPELPTLRNLKRALEVVAGSATNGSGPPKVVLNQYRTGTGVSGREVEQALGTDIFATLDWDEETVVQSLNLGQPVVGGRSRFGKALTRLGNRLAGEPEGQKESESRLLPSFLKSFRDKNSRK